LRFDADEQGCMMPLTFGSLFAGIGGFDLGFERAGFQCRWQVEIDEYATKILKKHWPKVQRQRDIRECSASNLQRVDCIIGGFPCQDISYAGRGAGLEGERSGLFFEAVRLVRELQPRTIVLENVAALLTRGLDRVLGTLAEIGYDAQWHCIPAAAVGAPHIRDRVFIIAYSMRDSYGINDSSKQARYLKDASIGGIGCWGDKGEPSDVANSRCELREPRPVSESCGEASPHWNAEATNDQRCGKNVANANGEGLEKWQGKDASRAWQDSRTKPSRSEWWSAEPDVCRVAYGIPARVDRLRCLGNAIVPQVAEVVAGMTMEILST
jgi:DNA (cytosine-5)-methyltransferase 1